MKDETAVDFRVWSVDLLACIPFGVDDEGVPSGYAVPDDGWRCRLVVQDAHQAAEYVDRLTDAYWFTDGQEFFWTAPGYHPPYVLAVS